MKIKNVHDLWTVASDQVEKLLKDHKEVVRTHEMANMFGKMNGAMKLKLEACKLAKITPDKEMIPELLNTPI